MSKDENQRKCLEPISDRNMGANLRSVGLQKSLECSESLPALEISGSRLRHERETRKSSLGMDPVN